MPDAVLHEFRTAFVKAVSLAASDALSPNGILMRQLKEMKTCPVFAGIRMPVGRVCLLFRLPAAVLRHLDFRMATRGFSAETIKSSLSEDHIDVVVQLAGESFRDHFEMMAGDLLAAASEQIRPAELAGAVHFRLLQWRNFCNRLDNRLSPDQAVGLAAELKVLNFLIDRGVHPDAAVKAWMGPTGHQHDFRLANISIEVKSCQSKETLKITLSSSLQLEPIAGSLLYLAIVRVFRNDPGGVSLNEVVEATRSRLRDGHHNSGLMTLNSKLILTGYEAEPEEQESLMKMLMEEPRIFHVHEGFPRIRSEYVPSCVEKLSYGMIIPPDEQPVTPTWDPSDT
jgi:hypothetical protein